MGSRKLISTAVVASLFFAIFPISAATASDTCVVDSFEDSAGADQNGSRTLEFCLDNIEDGEITFDTSSSRTIVLSSVLERAGDITIDGGGLITLAAAQGVDTRLLDVNGDLTLYGMNFEGGAALGDGGAVNTSGNAIVSNSTFRNNRALENETDEEFFFGDGGALYAELDIEIFGSTFVGNSADYDGGAVHSEQGTIDVESSVFESNHATNNGGAISLDDTSLTLTIRSSNFSLNTADEYGGAVFGDDDVNIYDSVFEHNSAYDGGAVYSENLAFIRDSLFESNSADDDGGAVYVDEYVTVMGSSFLRNEADYGGAIFVEDEDATLGSSSFVRNEAETDGGAFYIDSEDAFLSGSYFGHNSAGEDGGVAYVDEDIEVTNSTFYNNHAEDRGGVFIQDDSNDTGFFVYSTFASNTASEAPVMYFQGDEMQLFGSVFMDHGEGAFIYDNNDTGFVDLGANVTSGAEVEFDHESSGTGVSSSSVGLIAPGEPTLSFRPEIRFSSPNTLGNLVTLELAEFAADFLSLPAVDQSGNYRPSAPSTNSGVTCDTESSYLNVLIQPVGNFGGHCVYVEAPTASLGLDEVDAQNTSDAFDGWGEVFISEDNWSTSSELRSTVSQCEFYSNSTLIDPAVTSLLNTKNLKISCETDPVIIGSGNVIFDVVREFEGSFFSQKVFATIDDGTPGEFKVSIGGDLGSDSDTGLVESGTSGDWNYVVTGGDPADPILGFRSESSFNFEGGLGSTYTDGDDTYLTKIDSVTPQSETTEVFEAQVWFLDYAIQYEARATLLSSTFADAEFGCAIASVVSLNSDTICQDEINTSITTSFENFFPGATLTRGTSGFMSAPSPFSGPTVTDARVQDQELSISGTNLNLVSSIILGDKVLDLEENEGAYFVSIDSVPAGIYQLEFVHVGGSIETAIEVEIVDSVASSAESTNYWTTQISETEIKFYAKNIVGAGKVQFFHNGNEVAWVNAEDDTDPKLRVISEGPMAGANYLVRTREMTEGKNVFEIYVDGERVLRRAQGN